MMPQLLNVTNKLLIKWDAELLNLDDMLYYFITTIITSRLSSTNIFQKPSDVHIRAFMLLGKPRVLTAGI